MNRRKLILGLLASSVAGSSYPTVEMSANELLRRAAFAYSESIRLYKGGLIFRDDEA